ncbi:MAG: hypothetical protein K0S65_1951 [Labilithrix sp.]|nr:hypothetical protein [Labilithrix sp.]
MCTLVVAARIVPGFPLVVVANRDEQLDRASSTPRWWAEGFLAPRDEVAGGSWLGLNDSGTFVGITNRYLGMRDGSRTSRGALVLDALRGGTAREIHAAAGRIDPSRYNGFHLVYADEHDVLATISDGRELAQLTLGDGMSIVTERSFGAGARGDDDRKRVERIRAAWARMTSMGPFDPTHATKLLADHDDVDRLGATCIHLAMLRYGTRSSMVLAIPDARSGESPRARMLWAEGPPCTTPFREIHVMAAEPGKSG